MVLTGDPFAEYIRSDIRAWGKAIKDNDIRID